MKKDTRHRRYLLTINNPGTDWNHDKIREVLGGMQLKYWCMADEQGLEEQTPHTHIYFVAGKSAIRFSTVKGHFPTAHIEPAQADSEECRAYVQKSGKWAEDEKADTAIPGTFEEWGELPEERPGHRSDLARACELLESGASIMDIIRDNPDMMRYRSHLEQTRQDLIAEAYRATFRMLEVTYIQGATEMGKTRHVMDKYGYENVCQITSYQHGCFDKYQSEDVLILDEFAHSFKVQDMNNYLDGYPLMLPCRYANKVACYTKVYIISNIPLELQFPAVRAENPAIWNAFIRRVRRVLVFHVPGEFDEYTTAEYFRRPSIMLDGWLGDRD